MKNPINDQKKFRRVLRGGGWYTASDLLPDHTSYLRSGERSRSGFFAPDRRYKFTRSTDCED